MKICIRYFSGTGNTEYIAKKISQGLDSTHIVDMASIDEENITPHDLLIIGGPIYAGNCPEKLIRYIIRNVDNVNNKNAVVFTTSTGFLNAFGANSLSVKLQKKGYNIINNSLFRMPRNYYLGHYSPTEQNIGIEMINESNNKLDDLIKFMNHGSFTNIETQKKGVLGKDLLEEVFSIMARFMGKSYSVNEDCTKCNKCIKNCPTKNISYKGDKIKFGLYCMLCTRCIHSCPAHAIEYNKKLYPQYKLENYLAATKLNKSE